MHGQSAPIRGKLDHLRQREVSRRDISVILHKNHSDLVLCKAHFQQGNGLVRRTGHQDDTVPVDL